MRCRVTSGIFVLAIFLQTALLPTMFAQAGRDEKKAAKPPRALGLLELAPNGTAHLIPITILVDGKYYDASAYKAAPVPMALWSETVYEAFRSGVSQGLFTVTGALQRQGAKDASEWMGEGTWQSADSIKAKVAKKKVASEPRGMNEDEGPPVLRRADKPKVTEPPATPQTPQTPPAPVDSSNGAPAAPARAAPAKDSTSSPAASAPQDQAHDDQPPEDKNRPTLKRGKPAPLPAEEPETPVVASSKKAATAPTIPTTGAAPSVFPSASQIQLIPAISASNGPDPRPYAYDMKPEEEQQFRKKMLAMAADEVRARAAQGASGKTAPVHTAPQRGKASAVKLVQPDFEGVQLRVFDLANSNEPELVLTASARMPKGSRVKQSESPELEYTVTLVAREDVNGDFHKALANLTDAQHLDVLPRLELIDAVDVDGDGRGELLFRQVSDAGSAFVVYRVIGDRLYPLFQGTPGR
jgi:hypothetical protein